MLGRVDSRGEISIHDSFGSKVQPAILMDM